MFYITFMTWEEFQSRHRTWAYTGGDNAYEYSAEFPSPSGFGYSMIVSFRLADIPWGRRVLVAKTLSGMVDVVGFGSFIKRDYHRIVKQFLVDERENKVALQCGFHERLFV